MSEKIHNDILDLASLGNREARQVLEKLSHVIRVWDDLYDKDIEVTSQQADQAIASLAFDLGTNKFYRKHRDRIETAIFIGWNAWMDSNLWANDEDKLKKSAAWFIRDTVMEVVYVVAWLVGGVSHVRNVSPQLRHFYLVDLAQNEVKEREAR